MLHGILEIADDRNEGHGEHPEGQGVTRQGQTSEGRYEGLAACDSHSSNLLERTDQTA